ncbi:hypothetical protein BDQ12DRAFT_703285 [Crucibulum laeve]|uniref:ATP12-domain-containing protein n=1 Tax=Crucibulum laeve TaxID=68775 RepID=A0A5C3MC30_9AGAR|nr:hypothetical protein BDQ12DRAFT_703285 [Crucibulum laeve]
MLAARLAIRSSLSSRSCARRSQWMLKTSSLRYKHDGPAVTETNRAEATKQRFWKDVGIEKRGDQVTVTLDKRALKTPSGNTLLLPPQKSLLATLIAAEWDNQEIVLKAHALPITSITSRAVDALRDENIRAEVRTALLKYLDTDTVCFYEDDPPRLVKLQTEHWDPLHNWVEETFDVKLKKSESVLAFSQSEETKQKLAQAIESFDEWQMAAMERATYATKSFIIALALVKKHLTVEEAAVASHVEVNSQIELWGEVEDTHDVDYHDIRRQLGSAACILSAV